MQKAVSDIKLRALLLEEKSTAADAESVREVSAEELPAGDVLVAVHYSCVNYKDALALSGAPGIVSAWPMAPGIDLAGVVLESDSPDWREGDLVVATGWGIGERHWGGYASLARLKSEWLCRIPDGRDARWAMRLGTAGLTAMMCVEALENAGALKSELPIAVTGAGGGVGGFAIALLHALGVEVAAVSGRAELGDYLRSLGADQILGREEVSTPVGALASVRWGGVVDAVGGDILAHLLAEIDHGGACAVSGMAADIKFPGNVIPFLLRGISMIGIDSVTCPAQRRATLWQRMSELLPDSASDAIASAEIGLQALPSAAADVLAGKIRGRLLVKI